jgi:1-acyl-sn-glycerol-3-phosphate acyltransferase
MLYAILKPLAVSLMRLFFGLTSRGAEHVPAAGPVLLVANHVSLLDPPLIGGVSPRRLSFLAKAELFKIPLFGGLISRLGAQPLRREGADAGALRAALRVLKNGGALLMFPEGTRGEEGVLGSAKPGAGMLAVLGGAPVIPVYVRGSGRAWPRGRRFPRPANVTVTFGPPLPVTAAGKTSRKDDYEAVSRQMMMAIADLRDSASSTDSRATVVRAAGRRGAGAPPSEASLLTIVRAAGRRGAGAPPSEASLLTIARDGRRAVGGVGVGGARTSPKYTDGRNR